jgi:Rieske Fe-S protein
MSCEANGRRSFLRQSGCGLLTLAMLGLPDGAVALPISGVSGTSSDTERRYAIPQADGVSIDRRAQIILVRFANKVYAMALACPHENAAVKWLAKDRRFQCSKHDSRYTPEGTYTSGHTTRNLDRFPVRREEAEIVVTTDRVFRSDQNLSAWTSAIVAL